MLFNGSIEADRWRAKARESQVQAAAMPLAEAATRLLHLADPCDKVASGLEEAAQANTEASARPQRMRRVGRNIRRPRSAGGYGR